MNILKKSIKDFLSTKFLSLAFIPLVVSLVLMGALLYLGGSEIWEALAAGSSSGDFSFLDEKAYPFVAWLLKFAFMKWLIVAFFYTFGAFFALLLSIVIAVIVIGFLTPFIVGQIHKKYYANLPKNEISTILALKKTIMIFLVFLLILIISAPLMLVPLVNIFAINLPFFYLFYNLLLLDVSSNLMNEMKFKIFWDSKGFELLVINLAFFLMALIPFLGLFIQIFFVIYLSHYFYDKKQIYIR